MKRYLKLYLYFLRFAFSKALMFRIDFSFRIVMDIVYYTVNILFFKIIFLHTSTLAGFNEDQIIIFISSYLFLDSLVMTFLANNIWLLPSYINKGDLDYYLVRPVSTTFFVCLRDIAANSAVNMIIASCILIFSFKTSVYTFSTLQILFYFSSLLFSFAIYFWLRMLFIIPVFWTGSSHGFDEIFWGIEQCMNRPIDMFKGRVKTILTTILPFGIIISYPVKILFKINFYQTITHQLIIGFIFFILFRIFWKFGLKNYSSASS